MSRRKTPKATCAPSEGLYSSLAFVVPPGRHLDPQHPVPVVGCGEITDYTIQKDLQLTHGMYSTCQLVVPPGRKYYDRDLKTDPAYHTQWELIDYTIAKDLKGSARPGLHASTQFIVPTAAVTSPRKNVTVPSAHATLRRFVEGDSSRGGGGNGGVPLPPLPAPGTTPAPPPEVSPRTTAVTMAEVVMLRDGRGPKQTTALAPAIANAVASARLLKEKGEEVPEWERTARMSALAGAISPSQRASVTRAVASIAGAEHVLASRVKAKVDTSKYLRTLRMAKEGSLTASFGGTMAGLRRGLKARADEVQ